MPFSGFNELDPGFAEALQRFIGDSPGITPYSGYRSPERQAVLYAAAVKKYGSEAAARKWVAPPGRSRHGMRTAVDLSYANAAAKAWAHDNAARYGLHFPMSWEDWHIEPVGSRGQPVPAAADTPAAGAYGGGSSQPASVLPLMANQPQLNRPYTADAFVSDLFAGRNPIRQMVYGQIAKLFT